MSATGSSVAAANADTGYNPTQEVRFAVVMYGGVSLAIYINGVAQELLRVVRATADPSLVSGLDETERVYRKLGLLLHLRRKPGERNELEDLSDISGPIRTRIVVDVLSGTSAGGINAVFLAKALANRNRDLRLLKETWLDEADMDTLLNDSKSELLKYPSGTPKTSLLNSQRMYGLLLKALRKMDGAPQDPGGKPLANEIDLFATATDLPGLFAPIELTDGTAGERIHKMVFHFRCDADDCPGDFSPDYNRMLAFAARCTSSFPVALEPMAFDDIGPTPEERERFKKFFERYEVSNARYSDRPFADGGYLDNKPFGHAIEAIEYRDTDRPVQRKLLFVDPFPEYAGGAGADGTDSDNSIAIPKPDFIRNALAAATGLPSYQTIRSSIEQLNRRNRTLERLEQLRKRLDNVPQSIPAQKLLSSEDFATQSLSNMVERFGPGYAVYHNLKVFDLTDWLALVATKTLGLNEDSDAWRAIRFLVRAWRHAHYAPERTDGKATENEFLVTFDLGYRMRRLRFMRQKIDHNLSEGKWPGDGSDLLHLRGVVQRNLSTLRRARRELESRLTRLRTGGEGQELPSRLLVRMAGAASKAVESIPQGAIPRILRPTTYDGCKHAAEDVYREPGLKIHLDAMANAVAAYLNAVFTSVRQDLKTNASPENVREEFHQAARLVWDGFEEFEQHDLVTLPVLAGTGVKETGAVEIFRIGPADAKLRPSSLARGDEKLAGAAVGHFGAFLDEGWRENDMMWGRLDGAERIIAALLPDEEDTRLREKLTEAAQIAILREELTPGKVSECLHRFAAQKISDGKTTGQVLEAIQSLADPGAPPSLEAWAERIREREPLLFIRDFYSKPDEPPPKRALEWASRASQILGDMFRGLNAGDPETGNGPAAWLGGRLKLLGVFLAQLMAFTMPNTIRRVLLAHWLRLVALASILVILLGPLVSQSGIASVGWSALGLAAGIHVVTLVLGDWISALRWTSAWPRLRMATRFAAVVFLLAVAAVFAVGAITVWNFIAAHQEWFTDTLRTVWARLGN